MQAAQRPANLPNCAKTQPGLRPKAPHGAPHAHAPPHCLHSHIHRNLGVRLIALQFEVLKLEAVNVLDAGVDLQGGKGARLPLQLHLESLHVVAVDMSVAKAVHKVARLEVADLGHEAREQRVAGDVEGHAQAHVARPLVHLAAKLAPVRVDVELAEHVAWGESHDPEVGRVPGAEQDPTVVGVGLDCVNDLGQLIHPLSGIVGVHVSILCAKVSPLEPVDRTEVPLLPVAQPKVGEKLLAAVAVPDVDVLVSKLVCICRP
mmetsp:Transcript_25276/g.61324  ORF Transcript_25276/g.61324 Transcript_25276/m.61324 type:complete len:261 (-) Transcript_25276:620-1402(-)